VEGIDFSLTNVDFGNIVNIAVQSPHLMPSLLCNNKEVGQSSAKSGVMNYKQPVTLLFIAYLCYKNIAFLVS